MGAQTISWLLEGPEWLTFAVRNQLLNEKTDSGNTINNREIKKLVQVIQGKDHGFDALIKGNVSYTQKLYWYLFFLSDIGFVADNFNFDKRFRNVLAIEDNDHKFLISKEMKSDYFCISSILLTAMARMSKNVKDRLQAHLAIIMDAQRMDGGWHCAKNRAVGKKLEKSESCLMDNLNILMLFAEYEEYINEPKLEGAINLLLEHWRRRDEKWRPYGFGIGSDFKKLRYPASKYGILRVLDVLSLYPYAVKQDEFSEMLEYVLQKAENHRYRPESVSQMFKEFDFGQSKEPSRWLTFLIKRIERRLKQHKR